MTDAEKIAAVKNYGGLQFNDLLWKRGIELDKVLLIRHTPTEPELAKVLPWLVAEHLSTFNAYQCFQNLDAEKRMKDREWLASFLASEPKNRCLFVGLFRRVGGIDVPFATFAADPRIRELVKFGMKMPESRPTIHMFDLKPVTDFQPDLIGRLVCEMSEGRNFLRRAETNIFKVDRIHERSVLAPEMPSWKELSLSWDELKVIPESWKNKLREWRGIYLIFDTEIGQSYVGSAAGMDNLLGRWLNYSATGHGGNVKLCQRNPTNFLFTILERVSPDMPATEICALETLWKVRLHTREHGLNDN
jgi:hypothetical protein